MPTWTLKSATGTCEAGALGLHALWYANSHHRRPFVPSDSDQGTGFLGGGELCLQIPEKHWPTLRIWTGQVFVYSNFCCHCCFCFIKFPFHFLVFDFSKAPCNTTVKRVTQEREFNFSHYVKMLNYKVQASSPLLQGNRNDIFFGLNTFQGQK